MSLPLPRDTLFPTSRQRHFRPAVALATALAGAAIGAATVGPLLWRHPQIAAMTILYGSSLVFAGAVVGSERDQGASAITLVVAGLLWPLGWVDSWGGGPAPLVALFASPMALVAGASAMYRYPDPALVSRAERIFLYTFALWIVVGRSTIVITSHARWYDEPSSSWWPTIIADRRLFDLAQQVSELGEVLLGLTFLALWLRRARRAQGLIRRLALPVAIAGVVSGAAAAATPLALALSVPDEAVLEIYAVQAALLVAVPISFVVAVVRRRLSMMGVAVLVQRLSRGVTPRQVEAALSDTLADPDLAVLFWDRLQVAHVDAGGARTSLPADDDTHLTVPVFTSSGEKLAAIITRRPGVGYDELLDVSLSASALALENAQLQAELAARLAEVTASRMRIVEAGIEQRRRMERDLHDGVQQRLLGIKMTLGASEASRSSEQTSRLISQARAQLGEALEELRDLARGLHPPLLSQAGLAAAIAAMVENQPLDVVCDLPEGRFPTATEVTAYFVISEAVANIMRHARAHTVTITGAVANDRLAIRVADDGRGGADPRDGTGLSGLRDRVAALGGSFDVTSYTGEGTQIEVQIPCA